MSFPPHQRHDAIWPPRLPRRITPPATSLWHNLAINALRFPDKPALVFFDRTLTYRDVLTQAEALAATLARLGVQKGDRVLLNLQNCPQWVIAHFAILRVNAVVVPVNPMNRAEELKHYILDPDAKVAITCGDLAAELAKANAQLAPAERLSHMIVTHYSDAFDLSAPDAAMPEMWRDWLGTQHALPAMEGGQVMAWADALAGGAADLPDHTIAPHVGRGPCRSGHTALHQRHHRLAQGLHAQPRQHHAQRGGHDAVGQQ